MEKVMENKERIAALFLNKLNWKTNSGDIREFTSFQVDIYKFVFKDGLAGKMLTDFTAYINRLNMVEIRSVLKIFVWLYQHNAKFKLKFGWNKRLPLQYNIRNLFEPRRIRRLLLDCDHEDLMSYQLEPVKEKGE